MRFSGRRELKEYGNLLTHLLSNDSSISELIQIGYSYGCLVSSSFIPPPIIKSSHVFISYPLTFVPLLTLFSSYPKLNLSNLLKEGIQLLIIYGNQDEFTSQKSYDSWIEGLKKNDELKVVEIEGGNHFWNQKDQKNELLNRTDAFIDC